MTNRATLEALLARVLEGTGPDRELDAEIARAFGWIERYEKWWPPEIVDMARKRKLALEKYSMYSLVRMHPYTANLDAALTLVPEGWGWEIYSDGVARLRKQPPKPATIRLPRKCATPALAVVAVCIKARMEALGD